MTKTKDVKRKGKRFGFSVEECAYSPEDNMTVVDTHSDNDDIMLTVDPDNILTFACRERLAKIVARALEDAKFNPVYGGGE